MVGYEFKRERFLQLHRAAVGFPQHRFEYVGTPALNKGALQASVGFPSCVICVMHILLYNYIYLKILYIQILYNIYKKDTARERGSRLAPWGLGSLYAFI